MRKWCTVTVTDADKRRHSVDVDAESTCDAAHLYLVAAKANPTGLPWPEAKTVFEIVFDGKVYRITSERLRKWIQEQLRERGGPRGYLFRQRPTLD